VKRVEVGKIARRRTRGEVSVGDEVGVSWLRISVRFSVSIIAERVLADRWYRVDVRAAGKPCMILPLPVRLGVPYKIRPLIIARSALPGLDVCEPDPGSPTLVVVLARCAMFIFRLLTLG
jgi:hypothetical protein